MKRKNKNQKESVYSEKEYKEMRKRVREMENDKTGSYLTVSKIIEKL